MPSSIHYNSVTLGGIMLKKDVSKILKQEEVAKAIGKHQSQVSRLPNKIPEKYHAPLLKAAKRKLRLMLNAIQRMS